MHSDDLLFLFELLMRRDELSLLADLRKNRDDVATKNAYIDYLRDDGREESAKLLEKDYVPTLGQKPRTYAQDNFSGSLGMGYLFASGALLSGSIGSGQIGPHIGSGQIGTYRLPAGGHVSGSFQQ